MREFARAFRRLPSGAYETTANQGPVVVRRCARPAAWYAVNTGPDEQTIGVPAPLTGEFRDPDGSRHAFEAGHVTTLVLRPYELLTFVE